MSLKIYSKENKKWEKASSMLASSIKVIDVDSNYENENIEGCLGEIAQDITTMKKDIKYIYENGTLTGGPNGPGSSVPTIKIDGELDEQGVHQRVVKSDEVIDIFYFFNSPNPGNGIVQLNFGSETKTEVIKQGRNKWTVGPFERGTHYLSISVEDRQGFMSDPARIKIISGALEIQSTFSDAEDFALHDHIRIPYRVLTEIPEAITAKMTLDGHTTEKVINKGDNIWDIGTLSTLGVHNAKIVVETETAVSNELKYTLVVADSENIFVSTTFDRETVPQGKNLQIDYRISMKNQYQFKSQLWLNDELKETVRNPSGVSFWDLGNDLPLGMHTAKIVSMTLDEVHQAKPLIIEFEVVESGLIEITEPTNGLIAKFDSNGKNSTSEKKNVWEDRSGNNVACKLYNFNHATNGWFMDETLEQTVLKLSGKTYAEIDLQPFLKGIETGLTFDIYFKVTNTGNMDAKVVSCKNPLTPFQGFMIDTEKALLEGKQSVKTMFQEDTWTRITFVIDRLGRTIRTYTNAVISNASLIAPRDPEQDEFTYNGKIILGAGVDERGKICDNSTSSIRTIRVYNRPLSHEEILDIHMYDIKNADDLNNMYELNYGEIAIPTMTITGVGIEKLEPDQDSIGVKVDYVDPANPSKRFTKDLCRLAIQGTTSKYYPVKNYTLWLRENDGQPTRNYTPNDDWMPEDRWTLKTNYMDSSHANNVGLCKFGHELFKENPYPQQQINPATRSCADGMPIRLIVNGKDCGVYTWNVDRYAHNNYGLVTYNEDGTVNRHNMAVSYEVAVNSTNGAGAFNDSSWDSIKTEFKHRYNYRGDDVTMKEGNDTVLAPGMHEELVELVKWVQNSTDDEFRAELDDHFSIPHLIDYFLCVYAFGMIDNLGKNMVITSYTPNEHGHRIWYPSLYDCDSVLGLANNGELRYDAGVDMDADAFNTRTSALWTKLRKNFAQEIKDRYVELRRPRNIDGVIHPPIFSAENAMKYLDGEVMSQIGQRYYNIDAERKYINSEGSTWLIACNGTRKDFTKRWLEERFIYLDSVYENGQYNLKTMVLRTNVLGPITLKLKTYSPMWVRINYTSSSSKKIYVSKDRFYDFQVNMTNDLENDFTIYGADNLMFVNNMETLNVSHISIAGADRLIEVNCSGSEHIKGLELGENKYLQRVLCNDCKRLGEEERDRHLNLSGCENLKEVNCSNTKIATLSLPETGGVIEVLNCTNSGLTSFTMKGQEYLEELALASCSQLSSLIVENCNGLKSINMPDTILSSCIVRGCENVEYINISNTKFLETIDLRGCPGLKRLNLSGVLSKTLTDLDLTASLSLEELNISSTSYIKYITFGRYRKGEELVNFDKLKKLYCGNSGIIGIRYGNTSPLPTEMNLQGLNLSYVSFDNCPNLVHIKNINLVATGSMSPFKNCYNLQSIEGNIKLVSNISSAFYNCKNLRNIHNGKLNLDLSEVTSGSEIFYLCKSFTWNEVKFVMSKFSSKLNSLSWRCFRDCTGITGSVPADLFSTVPNLTDINEMFFNCTGITGELPADLFANCTKLATCTDAFYNTRLSGSIPNNFFKGPGTALRTTEAMFYNTRLTTTPTENLFVHNTNLTNCRSMFNNCTSMIGEIPANLFKKTTNLTDAGGMFVGCSKIYGEIPKDLFDYTRSLKNIDSMFNGTNMTGTIKTYQDESNKGIFDDLPNLERVDAFFPRKISGPIPPNLFKNNTKLVNVSDLFNGCTGITGELPATLFAKTKNLSLANRTFKNCTGLDTEIPKGFFDNCELLTEIEELFCGCKGIKGQIPKRVSTWHQRPVEGKPDEMEDYEVVQEYGLLDKCKVLKKAKGLFRYCNKLTSTIPETLFIAGGNIQDLSYIFEDCWELYGQIPEKLFENCKNLINLTGAFMDCVKLGKTELEITPEDKYAIPERLFVSCSSLRLIDNIFSMWGHNPYTTILRGELPKNLFRHNTALESCNSAFAGCSLITGPLDGDFFINCGELKNCQNMFWGPKFTSVGANILKYNTKISNIHSMFKGNNAVSGPAPKLWETPATTTTECFAGCTFSDQASIPPTYK